MMLKVEGQCSKFYFPLDNYFYLSIRSILEYPKPADDK